MPDVVFALVANPFRNSRALRQIRLLSAEGLSVHVLAVDAFSDGLELPASVEIQCVPLLKKRGPARFLEISRNFFAAAREIDASHFHASDLYVLGAMSRAAAGRASGPASISYDARECYPFVASTVGRPWVSWYWRHIEKRDITKAAFVFTVSESIALHMADSYNIRKPFVVMNVPESRSFEPSDHLRLATNLTTQPEIPIILHSGQMRPDRGCEILVRGMEYVDDAHLVFMGSGPLQPQLEDLAIKTGLSKRIHFIDPVSPDDVLSATSGAAIGVTLLQGSCLNHEFALPNKVFEYMSAGIPVLGSGLTELSRLLTSTGIGRTVNESDPESVGRTLQRMLSDPEARLKWSNAARAARETFNWDEASQPFRDAFREAMKIPGPGRSV